MKLCLYTYLEVIFLRMIKFAGLGYKCLQRGADWGSEKWIENGIIHSVDYKNFSGFKKPQFIP